MTRILVIGDEAASRATLTRLLPRSSYDVLEAADAHEGLQRLVDGSPEVLLVDLFMPERDGLETIPRMLLNCARMEGGAR